MSVTFLGTSSGGGPIDTRNCSSLVMDAVGDGSLWMVDCAEGTVRQFAQQPTRYGERYHRRIVKISKIFVTHMHADHVMGLITVLRAALGFPSSGTETKDGSSHEPDDDAAPKVEVYGPRGTRQFIRSILTLTHSRSADTYAAHELLKPGEEPSAPIRGTAQEPLHSSEVPGHDLRCGADGYWRRITATRMGQGSSDCSVVVDAGPIVHRDPCLGYVVREVLPETTCLSASRTLVILGDTSDSGGLLPLVRDPVRRPATVSAAAATPNTPNTPYTPSSGSGEPPFSAAATAMSDPAVPSRISLVVHECTDAYIPPEIDTKGRTGKNRRPAAVQAKAVEKGHSIPAMAGAFAKAVGTERLVLNHIGSRFPAPPPPNYSHSDWHKFQQACIEEIERQALESYQPPPPISRSHHAKRVVVAYDFLSVEIPPYPRIDAVKNTAEVRAQVPSERPRKEYDSDTHRAAGNSGRSHGGRGGRGGRGRHHSGGEPHGVPSKKPRR